MFIRSDDGRCKLYLRDHGRITPLETCVDEAEVHLKAAKWLTALDAVDPL